MNNNLAIAEAYYKSWGKKDVGNMGQHLHLDVHFIGPLAELRGKELVLDALKNGAALFNTLTIRAKFASENQTMLVIDLDLPAPLGNFPTASLMTFSEGLITKIELFFDAHRVVSKKDEIFSS